MLRPLTAAEAYLKEADGLLEKGKVGEASEKYYEAAVEAIKILAIKHKVRAVEEAKAKGDWDLKTIYEAVGELSRIYGERILLDWSASVGLVTADLSGDIVKDIAKYVRDLVDTSSRGLTSTLA